MGGTQRPVAGPLVLSASSTGKMASAASPMNFRTFAARRIDGIPDRTEIVIQDMDDGCAAGAPTSP